MELNKKDEIEIREKIAITNMKRLVIGLSITAAMEIFIIFFHDIPGIREQSNEWLYYSYFVLHGAISVVCLIGLICFRIFTQKDLSKRVEFYEAIVYTTLGTILLLITLIAGLDQLTTGQIVAFGVNIIYSGLVIIIKKPYEIIMYIICFIVFIIEMIIFQKNQEILFSHLMNGAFFFVSALFLAKFIYNNHFSHLYKNIKLEETNKKLQYLSNYDLLTEIPNRRFFKEQLEGRKIINDDNNKSYITVMDIDYFKNINDNYGHPVGDEILKQFAKILKKSITEDDILARFGGEEFIVFFSEIRVADIKQKVDSLREAVENSEFKVGKHIIRMTASFGISVIDGNDEISFERAYKFADKALYYAKESGRNKSYYYSE